MKNLDTILAASHAGDVIHLSPNEIYTTMGAPIVDDGSGTGRIKPWCVIFGHGARVVNIRPWDCDCTTLLGCGNNLIVDLIIDCGVPDGGRTKWKRNGFYGDPNSNTHLMRVSVLNARGSLPSGRESFGLSVSSNPTFGSRIEDCRVVDIHDDYTTAMKGSILTNNYVSWLLPPTPGARTFRVAYNMGDSAKGRVLNCTSKFANFGVYADWKNTSDLTVSGCSFYGCTAGMNLNLQTEPNTPHRSVCGVEFFGNRIQMNGAMNEMHGILLDHTTSDSALRENHVNCIRSVRVMNNSFDVIPGPSPCPNRYAINAASFTPLSKIGPDLGITSVQFKDNEVDDSLRFRNWRMNADIQAFNQDGTPVHWITT